VCCSVLQCVAVCCSVLQCVAVCCSVLQCVAVYTINSNVLSSRLSVRDLRWSYSHFLVRCCPTFPHYLHLPRIRWEVALSCPSILSRLCSLHATLRYTHSDAHAQVHYAHCFVRSALCNVQPIADRVAQNLENIFKKFQFSTRRTKILMGFIISTMLSRGTNRKYHGQKCGHGSFKKFQ